MRTTNFPPEFKTKVDMTKINLDVIKKWVSDEVARILNNDDDVVAEMITNILKDSKHASTLPFPDRPDIKKLQTNLAGFLDKDAPAFCLALWKMCLSAQDDPSGIPKELIEAKKMELMQERVRIVFIRWT
ncbi:hypothetical protein M409DRAFT_37112 [Zasmidium cellare ATCC 36951]|uniref:PWI domain-containing protein n=1 Tax=Zasmidium cellare ATCC 36951 TaxID=1080233 RepID=A0A6A6CDB3_ZASCE|nr:uncharacterized protein M409DRAFT_37112 [Zasmidium cellare ATCC 36951]KAF2164168.1 hypothetical protein M409DRAFT_37112 [Zasmidium cellare ATCC 36951]